MANSLQTQFGASVTREVATGVPGASLTPRVTQSKFRYRRQLTSSSTPPVADGVVLTPTLSGGALTLDFTALADINGSSYDASGKKLNFLYLRNGAANQVTIAPGASNGYTMWGVTVPVPAGGEIQMNLADTLADIDSTHKTLLLTGTGTQSFELILGFG